MFDSIKSGCGLVIGGVFALGFLFVLAVIIASPSDSTPSGTTNNSKEVKYKVIADGRVDITIENQDGGTSQMTDVSTPWTYPKNGTFKADSSDYVYVSAQRGSGKGEIKVQIIVNGNVWKESSSSGPHSTASQSGSIQ